MKTQTHVITAVPIGLALSYSYSLPMTGTIVAATIVGAVIPDIPTVAQYLTDIVKHRPPFSTEKEGTVWFITKDISHSPLLWILPLLVYFFFPLNAEVALIVAGTACGIFSHWLIDAFTHCGEEFKNTDQSLLWPFHSGKPGQIPKLGYLFGKYFVGWEYRYNYKIGEDLSNTKPFEKIWQATMLALSIILFLIYLYK